MTKEVLLKIANDVIDIGQSKKHYASVDICTQNTAFQATVYILSCNDMGVSNGITDSRRFAIDSDYHLQKKWLTGWKAIIETERDFNDSNGP